MRSLFLLMFLLPFTLLACSDDTAPAGQKEASVAKEAGAAKEAGLADAGACPTAAPTEDDACTLPSTLDCKYTITSSTCPDSGKCSSVVHFNCVSGKWKKTIEFDAGV